MALHSKYFLWIIFFTVFSAVNARPYWSKRKQIVENQSLLSNELPLLTEHAVTETTVPDEIVDESILSVRGKNPELAEGVSRLCGVALCEDVNHTNTNIKDSFNFAVRVLLDEKKINQNSSWKIGSSYGFLIFIGGKRWHLPQKELIITMRNNVLFLNNKKCEATTVSVQPIKGHLHFDESWYEGSFSLVLKEQKIHLINQLDIEDYIYSVLRWESWPGWPVEVNKAFAIACRSYLISKVLQAKKQNRFYHIKNTNIHQTYNGIHSSSTLQRAIDETRGLILACNKQPIEAMFDSCCGGIIPAQLSYIDFTKAPYLARTQPCTFCKTCKIYSWQISYTLEEFEKLLHAAGHPVKQVKEVQITKKDDAGSVQEVVVKDAHTLYRFTGKELYALLSKIKSFCYSIEKKGKQLYFKGRGYGHHIGICQWGARRMIDAGWNFKSILQFYYPGANLMALKNTQSKAKRKEIYAKL